MNVFERIPEKDWKRLHSLQSVLVERYCEQTLSHIRDIILSGKFESSLRQYQEVFQYIQKRERTLVEALNDFRRSNAIYKIVGIRRLGLFQAEEFDGFSDDVKLAVENFLI